MYAPPWATNGLRRSRRHSRWRLSSARLWPAGRWPTPTRAASQQAWSSTASCDRDIHQTCHMVWYEPGENLGSELLMEFEESLAVDAAADEASAREDAKLIDLQESERMPAA
eukprot:3561535-Pleurochrysis_carterae.AAC.1